MAISASFQTGSGTIASLFPVYYEKRMLERLYANLQFYPLAQKRTIPRGYGKTIVFNRPVKFGAKTTALTEGVTPNGNQASSELVSGTVKQYGDWLAKSDLSDMTALDVQWLADEFAYSAKLTIDQLIRIEFRASASAVTTAEASISSSNTMQAEFLRRLGAQLKVEDVPGLFDGAMRYAVFLNPEAVYDLQADTSAGGWHDSQKGSDSALARETYVNGYVRDLLGFRVFETTNLFTSSKTSSSGTAPYVDIPVFGRDAYGCAQIGGGGGGNLANPQVIIKPLGSGGTEDALNQRATIGWKVTFLPLFLATTSDQKRGLQRHVRYTAL